MDLHTYAFGYGNATEDGGESGAQVVKPSMLT